ncbi:hypothetical protein L208DRAFT_1317946, partial [Tricholoma matsutake]
RGEQYVPSKVHQAIHWKNNDPFLLSTGTDINWKVVDSSKPKPTACPKKQEVSQFVPAKGAQTNTPEYIKK